MKQWKTLELLGCTIALLIPVGAWATGGACQGVNADNLLACEQIAIVDCRTDLACSADRAQAFTVQDAINAAANKCCSKPRRAAQVLCLNAEVFKDTQSTVLAPSAIKPLMRAAKAGIRDLKSNGCETGSLGDL